ncbi:MAG: arginyltransferase, partial [Rhodobacteraceae bacterium]|nr:arginyltransferase [Paracoccaceae bacterium]
GMADMDIFEFAAMIEETPVRSRVIEYTAPPEPGTRGNRAAGRKLAAVCLTDVLDDGLSLVYSFYDPDRIRDGLGTYMILDHVALARQVGLPYVYLGYWVPGSAKMAYKARFGALEVYRDGEWRDIGDPGDYGRQPHPLAVRPITEQVAAITLPPTESSARPGR